MMTIITLPVLIILGLGIAIMYYKSKISSQNKSSEPTSQKSDSPVSNLFGTLSTKLKMSINDLNKGLRTTDVVREEIASAFEFAREDLKQQSSKYIYDLRENMYDINDAIISYVKIEGEYKKEASDFKEKGQEDKALNIISTILSNGAKIDNLRKQLDERLDTLSDFENKIRYMGISLKQKEIDIMSSIIRLSSVSSGSLDVSYIDRLMREFIDIATKESDMSKIDEAIDRNRSNISCEPHLVKDSSVSDEDCKNYFNNL